MEVTRLLSRAKRRATQSQQDILFFHPVDSVNPVQATPPPRFEEQGGTMADGPAGIADREASDDNGARSP